MEFLKKGKCDMRTYFHYTLYYIAIKEYTKEKILRK